MNHTVRLCIFIFVRTIKAITGQLIFSVVLFHKLPQSCQDTLLLYFVSLLNFLHWINIVKKPHYQFQNKMN